MTANQPPPARDAVEGGDWQLVPKEPTLEMQQAGYAALKLFFPDVVNPIGHYRIYEAVLAAAPVPPKPAPATMREKFMYDAERAAPDAVRPSRHTEQHPDSKTWTAGIDALRQYPYQDQQWHLSAIQVHHKDEQEAIRLRDTILGALMVCATAGV